jgi:nicotinamidase/pyrazinamidase
MIDQNAALIIVDVQYDFLPGGALAVNRGDEVITPILQIIDQFKHVVATQDWHPAHHGSFAANHHGKNPGEIIDLFGLQQVLWPIHCVQDSNGAKIHHDIPKEKIQKIFQKGTDPTIDSYSGFHDNGHKKSTGLGDYLKENKITKVYIAGLAADYCVKFTALDAIRDGFECVVLQDATKAVNLQPSDFDTAMQEMKNAGVLIQKHTDL